MPPSEYGPREGAQLDGEVSPTPGARGRSGRGHCTTWGQGGRIIGDELAVLWPPKRYIDVLTPVKVTFGKMRSLEGALIQYDWCSYKKREIWTDTGRMPGGDRGRGWNGAAKGQGPPDCWP